MQHVQKSRENPQRLEEIIQRGPRCGGVLTQREVRVETADRRGGPGVSRVLKPEGGPQYRDRNSNGRWREKRSDAGHSRLSKRMRSP